MRDQDAKGPETDKPYLIVVKNEPGTGGDIGFVSKLIQSMRGRGYRFHVLVDNMGSDVENLERRCSGAEKIVQTTIASYMLFDPED